jgi:membrane protein implicated in regulation of membrane protease activity
MYLWNGLAAATGTDGFFSLVVNLIGPMGRIFDFAKRRIVGYIVFWILVLLFLGIFYQGNTPAQASGLVILGLAFLGSLLYTRRMKRKQRARREAEQRAKQIQQVYQVQQAAPMYPAPPMGQAQQAQRVQPPPRTGAR